MVSFAGIVTDGHSPAQVVPVGPSPPGYHLCVKMNLRVIKQGTPPLTYEALRSLIFGQYWPLYSMPIFHDHDHPFSFRVTNNAGLSMVLSLDKMPATETVIPVRSIDIHATTYRDSPLPAAYVQHVLNQAVQWCNHQLDVPIPGEVEGIFESGNVVLMIRGQVHEEMGWYTFRILREALVAVNRAYRARGHWIALFSWIGDSDRPTVKLTRVGIYIGY